MWGWSPDASPERSCGQGGTWCTGPLERPLILGMAHPRQFVLHSWAVFCFPTPLGLFCLSPQKPRWSLASSLKVVKRGLNSPSSIFRTVDSAVVPTLALPAVFWCQLLSGNKGT